MRIEFSKEDKTTLGICGNPAPTEQRFAKQALVGQIVEYVRDYNKLWVKPF